MSNRLRLLALLLTASAPVGARAQSEDLLSAVKLHRAGARAQAESELRACTLSRCPTLPRLTLLTGYVQLSEGDARAARDTLQQAAPPEGLEAFHAYYLGQALFYAGDPGAAAEALQRAASLAPKSLEARAQGRAGEVLLAAGRAAEALPLLDDALKASRRAELYWARAAALGATGDQRRRLEDLRRLAVHYPSHPYGELALPIVGSEDKRPLSFDERLTRALLLLDDSPTAALTEVAAVRKQKLAKTRLARARIALIAARAHYALGAPKAAEAEVKLAAAGPSEVAAEALYARARHLLRTHDNAGARKVMQEISARHPRSNAAKDAGFYVGWLAFQAGDLEQAVKDFITYEQQQRRSRRRDEAQWFRALSQLLLNRPAEARTTLEALIDDSPQSSLVPQAVYWRARARQLEDPKADVAAEYERVIETFPASFYAVLASQRLRDAGRTPPKAFPNPPTEKAVEPPKALSLGVALLEAGLHADATHEIAQQTSRIRRAEEALEVGHALARLGEFGAAYGIANRALWGQAFTKKEGAALALMYPRPFPKVVPAESGLSDVPPHFTWSIMRRESTFRPELVSAADARGLMQVLPNTAAEIAARLEQPRPDPDALYSPELNVRLGAWYLGKLLERFGHPVLAAGAYNAGPPAVERWAKEHGDKPLDLFIELVSYRETRSYMKNVIADLHVYRSLYETDGVLPPLSLDVPTPKDGVRF